MRHATNRRYDGIKTLLSFPFVGRSKQKKDCKVLHSAFDVKADVSVRGLAKKFSVLHLTDTHISVFDEREKQYHEYGTRMDNAFLDRKHYQTNKKINSIESFYELMAFAKEHSFDLIVLTGDIVNNPSKASVGFVVNELKRTGIPSLYVAGNHDWHYEGMQGTADELRQTWIQNSLLSLYGKSNPLFSAQQIHGINFVCIDNSTYQVNEEQLVFYQTQMALDLPMVLLMHIPMYTLKDGKSKHVSTCGDPRWGEETDRNYIIERRQRWSKDGNLPSTVEFVESVKTSENLIASLVGHTHRARMDSLTANAIQYTTGGSYNGRYRIVEFKPLV